jgi:hypothetical protein
MRTAISILIAIHGIIHLFGFLKAYKLAEFNAITQPVSKTYGLLWLLSFLLFTLTIIFYVFQYQYWWLFGFMAVISSQVLIFNYWSDAKFGTIANVIILFLVILGYSSFRFNQKITEERQALFEKSQFYEASTKFDQRAFNNLPPIVQKWLNQSGILEKPITHNVYLRQDLRLKLKPEQENWDSGTAEQYFTTQPPAFNWSIHTKMNSMLSVVGRDKFVDGKGEMLIKLFSILPVANAKAEDKIDQATLQRYLAEIVWFPSAALSPYMTWEALDEYSARATMQYKGTRGSGLFFFDADGEFKKFVAMRYQDAAAAKPTK